MNTDEKGMTRTRGLLREAFATSVFIRGHSVSIIFQPFDASRIEGASI
jgi:hypothetical protein